MIIKVLLTDNDFFDIFLKYLNDFNENILFDLNEVFDNEEDTGLGYIEFFKSYEKVNDLLTPGVVDEITQEDKDFLEDRIRKSFKEFLISKKYKKDTAEIVVNNLKISFPDIFVDEWESKEAFYWLQHSGTIVNQ